MTAVLFVLALCGFYEGAVGVFGLADAPLPDLALAIALWSGVAGRGVQRVGIAFAAGAAAGAFTDAPWGLAILSGLIASSMVQALVGTRRRGDAGPRILGALVVTALFAGAAGALAAVLADGSAGVAMARALVALVPAWLLVRAFPGPRPEVFV